MQGASARSYQSPLSSDDLAYTMSLLSEKDRASLETVAQPDQLSPMKNKQHKSDTTISTNPLATLGSSTLQRSGTQQTLSASTLGRVEGGGGSGSLHKEASLPSQGPFSPDSSLVRGECIVAPAPFGPGNEYTEEVPRR